MKHPCTLCNKKKKVTSLGAEIMLTLFPSAPYACPKCVKQHGARTERLLLETMRNKCTFSLN